ncbi:hypothetical protein XAPC_4172 [Xanthomonas citri pv. punicae str. LMG 859]|nr:hypothetical protein XAPC_4172 [Xanthomonas citri pv. punicae str. LMG 859]
MQRQCGDGDIHGAVSGVRRERCRLTLGSRGCVIKHRFSAKPLQKMQRQPSPAAC